MNTNAPVYGPVHRPVEDRFSPGFDDQDLEDAITDAITDAIELELTERFSEAKIREILLTVSPDIYDLANTVKITVEEESPV